MADVDFGSYCITAQKLKLIDKDLEKGGSGQLLWGGQEVQLKANSFQQINVVAPLTISGSTSVTLESLWKPSSLSLGSGLSGVASDANGTLSLAVDSSVFATVASVNAKQDTLSTSGQGVFLNGAVLSGYDLRWNTSNVPSGPIQALHFKSGLDNGGNRVVECHSWRCRKIEKWM